MKNKKLTLGDLRGHFGSLHHAREKTALWIYQFWDRQPLEDELLDYMRQTLLPPTHYTQLARESLTDDTLHAFLGMDTIVLAQLGPSFMGPWCCYAGIKLGAGLLNLREHTLYLSCLPEWWRLAVSVSAHTLYGNVISYVSIDQTGNFASVAGPACPGHQEGDALSILCLSKLLTNVSDPINREQELAIVTLIKARTVAARTTHYPYPITIEYPALEVNYTHGRLLSRSSDDDT